MADQSYDICIVGGGIMGAATAYFCKQEMPGATVCIVEPDPTFAHAATPRASGGARRLFSQPENIAMSNYSIGFIKQFPRVMAVDGEPAPIDWRERGYLFIVPATSMPVLEQNAETQRSLGVRLEMLDPAALKARYPSMVVDDLGGGVLSPEDGWCDPSAMLQGFRRKDRALGVVSIQDRVADFAVEGGIVRAALLQGGGRVPAQQFVIATGAWANELGSRIGMPLPIAPMRRFEHFFTIREKIEPLPFVKDLSRLAFRPEGDGYTGSIVNSDEPRGFNYENDEGYFERAVWPALAHRFPVFEATKCQRSWAGLYELCELDGNPIIGNWPGRRDNVHVIAGFSGHGLMHAPAAGRGIAELIAHGRFRSIDLSRLGYERVVRGEPYRERGIL